MAKKQACKSWGQGNWRGKAGKEAGGTVGNLGFILNAMRSHWNAAGRGVTVSDLLLRSITNTAETAVWEQTVGYGGRRTSQDVPWSSGKNVCTRNQQRRSKEDRHELLSGRCT